MSNGGNSYFLSLLPKFHPIDRPEPVACLMGPPFRKVGGAQGVVLCSGADSTMVCSALWCKVWCCLVACGGVIVTSGTHVVSQDPLLLQPATKEKGQAQCTCPLTASRDLAHSSRFAIPVTLTNADTLMLVVLVDDNDIAF